MNMVVRDTPNDASAETFQPKDLCKTTDDGSVRQCSAKQLSIVTTLICDSILMAHFETE